MIETLEHVARAAGALAMSHFGHLSADKVEAKGPLDLVTIADRAVEAFLIAELGKLYPLDGIFGEEGGDLPSASGRFWVIDPIDGTFNFVRGGDEWGVSIGLFQDGAPCFGMIYMPVRDELYFGGTLDGVFYAPQLNGKALPPARDFVASRACAGLGFHPAVAVAERLETIRFVMQDAGLVVRTCGSCIASLMELARGETDGYLGNGESSWDVMAALAILAPLGFVTTIDWPRHSLQSKFKFGVGQAEFLRKMESLVTTDTVYGAIG